METVELHAKKAGNGPPVVILHGFLGSVSNWGGIARALAPRAETHRLDMRNHGASPWAEPMTLFAMARDVSRYVKEQGLGPVSLIGHSMGGKTAMMLALQEPALVSRLIVVDVAPAAYPPGPTPDFINAMLALDLSSARQREEVDEALAPTIEDKAFRGFVLQNLERDGAGFRWRANLEALRDAVPALAGWPDMGDARFTKNTAFICGRNSGFVKEKNYPAMDGLFPGHRLARIDGAGHNPHTDNPEQFLAILEDALSS